MGSKILKTKPKGNKKNIKKNVSRIKNNVEVIKKLSQHFAK